MLRVPLHCSNPHTPTLLLPRQLMDTPHGTMLRVPLHCSRTADAPSDEYMLEITGPAAAASVRGGGGVALTKV